MGVPWQRGDILVHKDDFFETEWPSHASLAPNVALRRKYSKMLFLV